MNLRIDVAEAESFAGVGRATLMRFANAGYFSLTKDDEGSTLFLKRELADLFNIEWKEPVMEAPSNEEASTVVDPTTIDEVGRSTSDYEQAIIKEDTDPLPIEAPSAADKLEAITTEPTPALAPDENFAVESVIANEIDFEINKEIDDLKREVKKLKRVLELQEQLLDSREAEIADLKQQRQWMQERIEKSEDKAERDQLLLISEMQMLSRLVAEQTKKRSPVVAALEWLGMREPGPAYTGNTIDYQSLKEQREQERRSKEKAA